MVTHAHISTYTWEEGTLAVVGLWVRRGTRTTGVGRKQLRARKVGASHSSLVGEGGGWKLTQGPRGSSHVFRELDARLDISFATAEGGPRCHLGQIPRG